MCLFRDYLVIVTPVSVLIQDLSVVGREKEREGGLIDSFAGSEHLYYDCPSHQPSASDTLPCPRGHPAATDTRQYSVECIFSFSCLEIAMKSLVFAQGVFIYFAQCKVHVSHRK